MKMQVEKGRSLYIWNETDFVTWTKCALSDTERKTLIQAQRRKEKQIKIRDFTISAVSQ